MAKPEPIFSIEKDNVGLGDCVIATWPDGKRVVVTGFGAETKAQDWIKNDSARGSRHSRKIGVTVGRKWTNEDDARLRELCATGKHSSVIAKALKRTEAAILSRIAIKKQTSR
jgi:hypothetical protein